MIATPGSRKRRGRRSLSVREPPRAHRVADRIASIVVDTNVLIDILDVHPVWARCSQQQPAPFLTDDRAVVVQTVFAELAAGFTTDEKLERALEPLELVREPLSREAAFRAGHADKLDRDKAASNDRRCRTSTSARRRCSVGTRCSLGTLVAIVSTSRS